MKKFIHAIQTADVESIEIWLSENALQLVNTPQPGSDITAYPMYHSQSTKEIYPLVLAWQLLFPKFEEKNFIIFKRLVAVGADFKCLQAFQKSENSQWQPQQSPLLHQLCERSYEAPTYTPL